MKNEENEFIRVHGDTTQKDESCKFCGNPYTKYKIRNVAQDVVVGFLCADCYLDLKSLKSRQT